MYRPGQALYALTKAALEHLTKQLAFELAPDRIRVNAVRPGPTDTPIHRAVEDPEARLRMLGELVPLGRVGLPEEIARWIWHLVDDEAGWVTGTVISVDGGRVLGAPDRS
jgi:NAD(P)-dependent dehydrogenase (short-subunit alcohol dehydrogenase family)